MSKEKKKDIILIILLLVFFFALNYHFFDSKLIDFFESEEIVQIERIVDGDTLIANRQSVRLLGINTPERGEKYYEEAKQFLESIALNKTAHLKFGRDKIDKYNRTLAYVYINGVNVNLELVKKGFANIYFLSGKDMYYGDFLTAWENCNENLCEISKNVCTACVELKEFDYLNQKIVLKNNCSFSCNLTDWILKAEGRKKFIFPEFILNPYQDVLISVGNSGDLVWNETTVWTKTGDSLFLWDAENMLILWESF